MRSHVILKAFVFIAHEYLLNIHVHKFSFVIEITYVQKHGPKMLDHEGKEVPGNRGYRYFGAARDLPGVRELFMKKRELC